MRDFLGWLFIQLLKLLLPFLSMLILDVVFDKDEAGPLRAAQAQMQTTLRSFNPWQMGEDYLCIVSSSSNSCFDSGSNDGLTQWTKVQPNPLDYVVGFFKLIWRLVWRPDWVSRITGVLQLALGIALAYQIVQSISEEGFLVKLPMICVLGVLCACLIAFLIYWVGFLVEKLMGGLIELSWLATAATGYIWLSIRLFQSGLEHAIDERLEQAVNWITGRFTSTS